MSTYVCMCVCVPSCEQTVMKEPSTPHTPLMAWTSHGLGMRLAYPGHGQGESEARTSLGCSGCSAITSVGPSW